MNSLGIRVYSFDHRGHGRTHHIIVNENESSNESKSIKCKKQGYEGHIEVDKSIIMGDIKQLIGQAAMDGIPDQVPKFLLGHSLGGLMVINYALERGDEEDEEFKKFKGIICIGNLKIYFILLKIFINTRALSSYYSIAIFITQHRLLVFVDHQIFY